MNKKRRWQRRIGPALGGVALVAAAAGCGSTASTSAANSGGASSGTSAQASGGASSGTSAQASGSGSGQSGATTKITFVGDWSSPNVLAIPIVAAIERHDYSAAGISLHLVLPPNNSTDEQMVGIGQADLGASTNTSVMDAKIAGLPIVAIANESGVNNWGLFYNPGTKVNGATLTSGGIGGYGDTFTKAMLPFFYKKYGVDAAKAKVVTVTNDDIPLMIDKKILFATSTTNFGAVEYQQTTGHAAASMLATQVGAPNSPIWVYIGNTKWLASHSALATKFLNATLQGTTWAVANPKAAAELYMKYFKSTGYSLAHNLGEWKATAAILKGSQGYFLGSASQWTAMAEALNKVGSLSKVLPASSYFTNKYVGKTS